MKNSTKALLAAAAMMGLGGVAHAQGGTSFTYNGSYERSVYEGAILPSAIKAEELNISGAVGLPLNPTAQIPEKGQWRVQGSYYDLGSGNHDGVKYGEKKYGAYIAGAPTKLPLEISLGVSKMDVNARNYPGDNKDPINVDGTGFSVGAKYQLWRSDDGTGMASLGLGYDKALYKNMYAYFVTSKAFGSRNIVGHVGLRYDRYKINGFTSNKPSVFVGAEVPLDKQGRFSIIGEVQSKNAENKDGNFEPKIPYSLAVRLSNGDGMTASVGIQRQGTLTSAPPGTFDGNSNLFFQLGRTF